jgi:hypothetical protein
MNIDHFSCDVLIYWDLPQDFINSSQNDLKYYYALEIMTQSVPTWQDVTGGCN